MDRINSVCVVLNASLHGSPRSGTQMLFVCDPDQKYKA